MISKEEKQRNFFRNLYEMLKNSAAITSGWEYAKLASNTTDGNIIK